LNERQEAICELLEWFTSDQYAPPSFTGLPQGQNCDVFVNLRKNASFQARLFARKDEIVSLLSGITVEEMPTILMSHYSRNAFGRQLCNYLSTLYSTVEEPLTSKLSVQSEVEKNSPIEQSKGNSKTHERKAAIKVNRMTDGNHSRDSQSLRFFTQPLMLPNETNPQLSDAMDDDELMVSIQTTQEMHQAIHPRTKFPTSDLPSQIVLTEMDQTQPEPRAHFQTVVHLPTKTTPLRTQTSTQELNSQALLIPPMSSFDSIPSSPFKKPAAKLSTETLLKEMTDLFGTEPFPARALRALIDNDEQLANIFEGNTEAVQTFIGTSNAAMQFKAAAEPVLPNRVRNHARLTDRHDSAEQISWTPNFPKTAINEHPKIVRADPKHVNGRRAQVHWTQAETDSLIRGMKVYGSNWSMILKHYKFANRTSVDLKDRARTLQRSTLRSKK